MSTSRRSFLAVSAAVSAGFLGLNRLIAADPSEGVDAQRAPGFGPLKADPQRMLDLPEGFRYTVVSRYGQKMDDGLIVPGAPDGMATFPGPDGTTILIRNHELMPEHYGPFGPRKQHLEKVDVEKLYDAGGGKTPSCGGTTTVVYDTKRQRVLKQFLSLGGTIRNCAGGPTPWRSWISCEETLQPAGYDRGGKFTCDHEHGYNFEVPASDTPLLTPAVPLKAMGRFNHEAVAVDPASGIVFQTEDRHDGLIYRFIPREKGKLSSGGKLQALKIKGSPSRDTRNWVAKAESFPRSKPLPVEWIDLDQVESPEDDLRYRGFDAGAARFARGEGMWTAEDGIYFACTSGGRTKKGQIFRYRPAAAEGTPDEADAPGTLELFIEPNNSELVEACDNVTVSPWGDLILCEDHGGFPCRLVGVTPEGKLYTFAKNHAQTEFAGSTFSPDGTTLFVNLQHVGLTVAIVGPWDRATG